MILLPVLFVLRLIAPAAELAETLQPFTPHLDAATRFTYSIYLVEAGEKYKMDPILISAFSLHESRMKNMPRNRTNDYGLMQVHWQKAPCLTGLARADLMDPATNIDAGVCELAHWRSYHASARTELRVWRKGGNLGPVPEHRWYGHYKNGNVVRSTRYEKAILSRVDRLKKRQNKLRIRPPSTS